MSAYALPALFALFVWWFSTGLIIYLDNLPKRTFKWSMAGATCLLAASLYGLAASSGSATVLGACVAFTCGVLAWGWQEISFYMGFVTGPRSEPCPEGCAGWKHFLHAIQTSLWHELAIIASAAAVFALTWGEPNQVGTWTFMVLWWMHQSAKLNVFLGVRNLNEEFLPEHLGFLKSFLTKKPMNLLFPVSITVSTCIAVLLAQRAAAPGADAFTRSGYTFLAALMTLAILEHWFLVLPLPAAKLWSWGLRSRKAGQALSVEIVAGFLGAGKTTYLRHLLATAAPGVPTVVLVNDFSSVGVDGSLLRERGADVVELPNGCICCSLRNDLADQLRRVVSRWSPRRILIEPSGVADVAALVGVLARPDVKPLVTDLKVSAVVDAGAFLHDYARMTAHFEAQVRVASTLIVNKVDVATEAELRLVMQTVRAINPNAAIVGASYGVVQAGALPSAASARPVPVLAEASHHRHEHHHGHEHHHDHDHGHHGEEALGLTAWSSSLGPECDAQGLSDVLDAVALGAFGGVERVKGIARAGAGWIRFDVAGGRPSMAAFAPREDEQPRVIAIGRRVDEARLQAAFAACAAKYVADEAA